MKVRSVVFVVTLAAGMLGIVAPPAAADTGCGGINGNIAVDSVVVDQFAFITECTEAFEENFDESGDIAFTASDGTEVSAASAMQYRLTPLPPEEGSRIVFADAVGDLSTSLRKGDGESFDDGGGAVAGFRVDFEIPEGATGSVFANVSGRTTGRLSQTIMRAFVGGHEARVELPFESPGSGSDSIAVDDLGPGQHSLNVQALVSAAGSKPGRAGTATGHFDVTVMVGESACENTPTTGDDIVTGTPNDDLLCGGAGNDSIEGLGGNDIIIGGADSDSILGGDGFDTLEGGAGDDFIEGGPGNDIITGGAGSDGVDAPLSGGDGDDTIDAGDGPIDSVSGGNGDDTIDGGGGTVDSLNGDLGDDTIDSSATNNFLHGCNDTEPLCDADQADLDAAGVTDKDTLTVTGQDGSLVLGGSGNDTMTGDAGSDQLEGGRGDDFLNGAGARDLLRGDQGDDFILGGPGHESGTQSGDPREISGGAGNDDIFGGPGDDLAEGGSGNDEMQGNNGSDKLRGQADNDCLVGGTRKDVLVGGPGGDRLLARDGVHDVVNGGPNFDRARVDGVDDLIRVENDNFQGDCT